MQLLSPRRPAPEPPHPLLTPESVPSESSPGGAPAPLVVVGAGPTVALSRAGAGALLGGLFRGLVLRRLRQLRGGGGGGGIDHARRRFVSWRGGFGDIVECGEGGEGVGGRGEVWVKWVWDTIVECWGRRPGGGAPRKYQSSELGKLLDFSIFLWLMATT